MGSWGWKAFLCSHVFWHLGSLGFVTGQEEAGGGEKEVTRKNPAAGLVSPEISDPYVACRALAGALCAPTCPGPSVPHAKVTPQ